MPETFAEIKAQVGTLSPEALCLAKTCFKRLSPYEQSKALVNLSHVAAQELRMNPKPALSQSPKSCWVYFILAPLNGLLKIGVSVDPKRRMVELRRRTKAQLELIGVTPGSYRLESVLHSVFGNLRISGEWFSATPELLKYARENTQQWRWTR